MRWILFIPAIFLLSACIYTEGTIITEPEDIVISPKAYKYTPWYPCDSVDVSQAERYKKCPRIK